MIDTHAHLGYPPLAEDVVGVLAAAHAAGITDVIIPGTTVEDSLALPKLQAQAAVSPVRVHIAAGIHPDEAEKLTEEALGAFSEYVLNHHRDLVAIGEVGLDFYRLEEHVEAVTAAQYRLLDAMVALAERCELPLIIHSRACFSELHAYFAARTERPRAVVHCFDGDAEQAHQWLDLGFYLSVTNLLTYPKNHTL